MENFKGFVVILFEIKFNINNTKSMNILRKLYYNIEIGRKAVGINEQQTSLRWCYIILVDYKIFNISMSLLPTVHKDILVLVIVSVHSS